MHDELAIAIKARTSRSAAGDVEKEKEQKSERKSMAENAQRIRERQIYRLSHAR